MAHFVDRAEELAALDRLTAEDRPPARRFWPAPAGKTTLLLEFAAAAVAGPLLGSSKQSEAVLQRSLYERSAASWISPPPGHDHPSTGPPFCASERVDPAKFGQQRILSSSTVPYASRPRPRCLPSFRTPGPVAQAPHQRPCGHNRLARRHDGRLQEQQAPLYGRFTAQLPVGPLPFSALAEFFPGMTAAERGGIYAILAACRPIWSGSFPGRSIRPTSSARPYPPPASFAPRLVHSLQDEDLDRDTHSYHSILQAIGKGHIPTTTSHCTAASLVPACPYLERLMVLGYVERRLPATGPRAMGPRRQGRYVLADQFLAFLLPLHLANLVSVEQGLFHDLWRRIDGQMRAFSAAPCLKSCAVSGCGDRR